MILEGWGLHLSEIQDYGVNGASWRLLSDYRDVLYGIAILCIIVFHLYESTTAGVLSRLLRKFQQAAAGRRHDHSSSSVTSRYLLDPHSLSATYLSLAVTSMSALLPSGNVPTTRVRRRISRFSRSMALFVRMRRQCRMGKRV